MLHLRSKSWFKTLGQSLFLCGLALGSYKAFAEQSQMKLGVLFGSYGDVDSGEEAKELVTTTLQDPDMIPLPRAARFALANLGWIAKNRAIKAEYAAIGGKSNFRANSQLQADLVASYLKQKGFQATGYTGFAFTFPHIEPSLAKAQRDGINRLVVFYQGAQHSRVTSHIVFRNVKAYLKNHPEWRVKVTAVKSFSDDPRFIELMAASIQKQIQDNFPNTDPSDVCLFLPMHGNIMTWINQGDPSYNQMMAVMEKLKERFQDHPVYYGFQNHDEFPLLKWTQPKDADSAINVGLDPCRKVVINGRISFTIDSLETLYDHVIIQKDIIIKKAREMGMQKDVVVATMFNGEPDFARFLADLTIEALRGEGRLLEISEVDAIRPPLSDEEG